MSKAFEERKKKEDVKLAMDYLARVMAEVSQEEEAVPQIADPERIKEVQRCYKMAKKYIKGTDVQYKLSGLDNLAGGYASVTISGKELYMEIPGMLAEIVRDSSNVEIHAFHTGRANIDISFYGLTRPVEPVDDADGKE